MVPTPRYEDKWEKETGKEDVDDDAYQTHRIILHNRNVEERVQTHPDNKEILNG